jgi:hypothetical protein
VEIHEFDFVFLAVADDVGASKFSCWFLQILHQQVGVHCNALIHYDIIKKLKFRIQNLEFRDFIGEANIIKIWDVSEIIVNLQRKKEP